MKKVLIFGSTGAIGRSTLDVIRRDRNNFKVIGVCVYRNIKLLKEQIDEFEPEYVCVVERNVGENLQIGKGRKLFLGEEGLREFSSVKADISVMAISGISSLNPLLTTIENAEMVALANKESLVVGGFLVKEQARKFNTKIIPIDSEISALFQLLNLDGRDGLEKVYLTASGGSLLHWEKKDIERAGVKDVLNHPVWKMGKRITVDSATLVNKGFEVVETNYFFDLDYRFIDIIIHKECLMHAMIKFKDNIFFACFYNPDMRIPISFALYYPDRRNSIEDFNFFSKPASLSFSPVDYEKFPLLKVILEAAKRGGNSLVVVNACDEVAVDYFLKEKINFYGIFKAVDYIFNLYEYKEVNSLEEIFFWDRWAREKTEEYLRKLC